MAEQLSFPELDGSACPSDGLFFAVFPELSAAMNMAEMAWRLSREHRLTGKPRLAERLHVSLYHLGDYAEVPRGVVGAAHAAAADVVMPSFAVAFDRVASFNGGFRKRALVLLGSHGMIALLALRQRLGSALQKAGLWRRVKPRYEPHVTLLYDDRGIVEQTVEAVGWTVNEFVLVHSRHGQTCYDRLGWWPLRDI